MKVRVGIPRALSYYTFYPLWLAFIEKLGAEVVLSHFTNRAILEDGIKETVNDACIPIKVFHGHVMDLKDRVDYIFAPRMVSADGIATFCPKFLGLPDMVRHTGVKLPPLIDVRYKCSRFTALGLLRFFKLVAAKLGVKNPLKVCNAAIVALWKQKKYQKLLLNGLTPTRALEITTVSEKPVTAERVNRNFIRPDEGNEVVVALLGYPYAIYDSYITAGLYDKLDKLGVRIVTTEQIPLQQMQHSSKSMPQNFFWHYSNQVCWAGLYLLSQRGIVDGIIHVTAFGCGPDAMVDKTLELEAKSAGLPFLSLTIDEHTGEGGVQTRLEAFVDMLQVKQAKGRAG